MPFVHWQPSLAVPLQLLSLPASQVSAPAGPTDPEHALQLEEALFAAKLQLWEPALQGPFPSFPGCAPQAWAAPGEHWQTLSRVLSGLPSQLLSFDEEQSLAMGSTLPTHGPHCSFSQVCIPGLQMPTAA